MQLFRNDKEGSHPKEPQSLEELQGLLQIVSEGKRVWESTFDAIVDPVLIVSKDYLIQRANLAAAKSSNEDVRDLIGKRCYEVFAKRKSPCFGCPMEVSRQEKRPRRKRLKPYEDQRAFAASSFPVRGKNNEDLGFSVMQYQDIRAIRELEAQLVQKEKMAALGQFASGIAHDINNPLSGVLAFAQLAMRGLDQKSQIFDDLQEIEKSALRCKKIIEDLLLFCRPISESERVSIDFGKLIQKILPSLEVQWKELDYNLKVDLKELSPVHVCESKLEQVFTNILSNAFQAIPKGGEIVISSGEEDEMVFVTVADNGEGISRENLERVFDPYFTTKRAGGGTGLGLSTAYNIVQEHGGRIKIKSKLGEGTSIRVFIPKGDHK